MILTSQISEQFGKWIKYFRSFIESPEMDKIFIELKSRKARSIRTAPLSQDLFRAFKLTDPDKLKCIIVGICPYHTFSNNDKGKWKSEEFPVADGLCLSCSRTDRWKEVQPSLSNFYDVLEGPVLNPLMTRDHDLKYLADQGVLLYNVALTVQEGKPLSDNELWFSFNKYFWEEVINKYFKGLPILLMGTQAHKSEQYIAPMLHYTLKCSHPASASYKGVKWDDDGQIAKINQIIKSNNGESEMIQWFEELPF